MFRPFALPTLCAALGLAQLAAIAVPAPGQDVRESEPVWRVVARDGTPARCGPDGVFYAIAELQAGSAMLIDGEAGTFSRARYPVGMTPYVPADEVTANGDGRLKLTKDSGLRAPSELLGLSGSWRAVYDPALPAGTGMVIVETLKNDAGDVVGYRVAPVEPPVSKGYAWCYIPTDALRDATPDEIARAKGGVSTPTKPAETEPAAAARPEPSVPADRTTTSNFPNNAPINEQATEATDPEPAGDGTRKPVERPSLLPAGLEDLEATFDAARRQAPEELDQALDELLAEFNRTRASVTDDERLAWQLDQRIEWLKLRIETRDQRRAIKAALAEADERAAALQKQVDGWQQGRAFQLVGRLVMSSVYNGERLPRMYRVQAVDSIDGTPRTLGYLLPNESLDKMLGSVVGIVGEARFDPQLRLVVIRPDRIDVMPR